MANTTIARGGVMPSIHPLFIPYKTKTDKDE